MNLYKTELLHTIWWASVVAAIFSDVGIWALIFPGILTILVFADDCDCDCDKDEE